jgi:type VI secretion system protein ImpA
MDTNILLSPFTGPSPSGEDMSFSIEFDQIREMRRADDPTLDQGAWVRDLKTSDWIGVEKLCIELLSNKTKDLRVAAWLTNARSKNTQSFAALAEGISLCHKLCEQFWDSIYPLKDEDGYEERIGNLTWLLAQITNLAGELPLVSDGSVGYGRKAFETAKLRSLQNADSSGGNNRADEPTLEELAGILNSSGKEFMLAAKQGATEALANLKAYQTIIDGYLGADGPSFVPAKQALEDSLFAISKHVSDKGFDDSEPSNANSAEGVAANLGQLTSISGPIQTRKQAIQQLRQVADFFRRTEPHSPVTHLAEKAAGWGELTLHEWLKSVVKDPGSLSHVEELLGIKKDTPPEY